MYVDPLFVEVVVVRDVIVIQTPSLPLPPLTHMPHTRMPISIPIPSPHTELFPSRPPPHYYSFSFKTWMGWPD
jgi:hypothetical protein